MKERPILFSTAMVKAILAGNKTMTRRVANPDLIEYWDKNDPTYGPFYSDEYGDYHKTVDRCPYGQPGGLLWVRETWAPLVTGPGEFGLACYKASDYFDGRWKPSIHMPKKFCRIWLRVKSVRVERLHDITGQDALAEGIKETKDLYCIRYGMAVDKRDGGTAVDAFRILWDSINGKPRKNGQDISWADNPWVWVVEFDRVDRPQAAKEG